MLTPSVDRSHTEPPGGLPPEFQALLPTEDDVAFYQRNGYWISPPGVVPETLIETALHGAERLYRGEIDRLLPTDTGYSRSTVRDARTPRNDEFVSLQIDEFARVVRWPLLGAIAARLTRSASVRLLDDQLVWKPPSPERVSDTVTGWHADGAYWSTCTSSRLTTAWIPLHDVTIDNAPLVVLPGSHRWSGMQGLRQFNLTALQPLLERLREEGRAVEPVPMTLARGQVSFHDMWTVHASLPNAVGRPRIALAVHMQDGDNRYRPFRTPEGREIHIFDEQLCRRTPEGDPDFTDPRVFPVLWAEPV